MFLINSFTVLYYTHSTNSTIFTIYKYVILLLIHVRSSVVLRSKELVLCTLISSVFRVFLSNK